MRSILLFTIMFVALGKTDGQAAVAYSAGTPKSQKLIDQLSSKPEFPGGFIALLRFLQKNIQYPMMERDNNIQGRVNVSFIIDKSGKVTRVKALNGPDQWLKKEAVRVVKLLPDWKPGIYNNKPVPVYYTVDVDFKLQ